MNIMTIILTVTMIWMILIFISLPLFLKKPEKVQKGNDEGAPEVHYFKEKLLVTFLLSILFAGIYFYLFYLRLS